MDDTAQNQVQSSKFKIQNSSQSQDDVQQSIQQPTPVQAPLSQPVGSAQKEQGPVVYQETVQSNEQQQNGEEYLKPSEIESLPKEVEEVGVETTAKKQDVVQFTKQTAIEPAKESTPVSTSPSGKIQLPMTEKEALRVIKTTSVKNSEHWMAVLVEKIYEQLRLITGKK